MGTKNVRTVAVSAPLNAMGRNVEIVTVVEGSAGALWDSIVKTATAVTTVLAIT